VSLTCSKSMEQVVGRVIVLFGVYRELSSRVLESKKFWNVG
jgi:hypothetical protein